MVTQLKWAYALPTLDADGVALVQGKEVHWTAMGLEQFLRNELNDVNPLLIKIATYAKFDGMPLVMVFYPAGVKELESLPGIGSTDRWVFNVTKKYATGREVADKVVSLLDNLDPAEAIYAKVSLSVENHSDNIFWVQATVIVPEGAK